MIIQNPKRIQDNFAIKMVYFDLIKKIYLPAEFGASSPEEQFVNVKFPILVYNIRTVYAQCLLISLCYSTNLQS